MIIWGDTIRRGSHLMRVGYDREVCWLVLCDQYRTGIHMALLQSGLQEGRPSEFWLWQGERFIMVEGDDEEIEAIFDLTLEEVMLNPAEFFDVHAA